MVVLAQTDIINGDVNEQNVNGNYFVQFLVRMPSLTLINSVPLCEGKITRIKKTTRGVVKSILDFFGQRIHRVGRVIESDLNPGIHEMNLQFSKFKSEMIECFQNNLPFEIQAIN